MTESSRVPLKTFAQERIKTNDDLVRQVLSLVIGSHFDSWQLLAVFYDDTETQELSDLLSAARHRQGAHVRPHSTEAIDHERDMPASERGSNIVASGYP